MSKPIIEWVEIPGGIFDMGSTDFEDDGNPDEIQHQVKLDAFAMSKYAVTFDQYDAFCDEMGFQKPRDDGWGRGKRPVIHVSWEDANNFALWMGCRLPTEAEWEYACRAGTTTAFNTGNRLSKSQANFDGSETMPVGTFPPNAWGLYDMHGNVLEWCNDWYGDYSNSAQTNPAGPSSGSRRVNRGGGWRNDDVLDVGSARRAIFWNEFAQDSPWNEPDCRSAYRTSDDPDQGANNLGFRLVSPRYTVSKKSDRRIQIIYRGIFKINAMKPKIEWVEIPGGMFGMGSLANEPGCDKNERKHLVILSAFKMSRYAVTFEQYDAFCDEMGFQKPDDAGWGRGKRPVIHVTWEDANHFALWMGCRLPTEAEWEYACRAGTTTAFNTGNSLSKSQANFYGSKTMPVGTYPPNAWGLYDMHGNVWEWCSDWYGDYSTSAQTNPAGSSSGSGRVDRGGSWDFDAQNCRSACRDDLPPNSSADNLGFRLVSPM